MIISNKNGIYELPQELPLKWDEQLKNYNLSKLEKFEKISKKHTSFNNENFVNTSKKLLEHEAFLMCNIFHEI